jgi:serine protease AprX
MKKIITLSICLITLLGDLKSQSKYWVSFTDKNNNTYTLANPFAFMSTKSLARRSTYGILMDQSDLPVTASYISQVASVPNVTVTYASKWMNSLVIAVSNTAALATINSFPFVVGSVPVSKYKLSGMAPAPEETVTAGKSSAVPTPSAYYGGSWWQNKQLGSDCLHNQGYRGQGMTIAVLDAGFNNVNVNPVFDSLRNRGGILGTRDFVTGGTSVYEDDSHGALVLSCMAAIKPNVILGSAPMADYWLLRTEAAASELIVEEYNWIRGAEFADSAGADILTTSLGYTTFDISSQNHSFADLTGKVSKMSIAATMAARKGMFVLNSAGNGNGGSWPKIGIPADADSICTVGAIDSLYNVAGFSSLGPTADGRIKPDLVARGSKSWVSFSNGSCGYSNGTSFSCPILAGAVACFWQAHKSYNNIKVLDTLRKTASYSLTPNNSRGWGTTNMCLIAPILTPVAQASLEHNFNLYPNPFSSKIRISATSAFYKVEMIDGVGAVMESIHVSGRKEFEIDLSELSAGFYFIRISSAEGSFIKKIVKQD